MKGTIELKAVNSKTDLALFFGCKERTLEEWIRRGKFPRASQLPGGKGWPREVVAKWLTYVSANSQEIKATAENATV